MDNFEQLIDSMNDEQKIVINDIMGPSICVAGPGSGKTRCIVARTATMIKRGIPGNSILLFTFTRKAANELHERITHSIGAEASNIMIGTYHSVCGKLLRKYCNYIGYKSNFAIYDDDDRLSVIKNLVNKAGIDIDYKKIAYMINQYKIILYTPEKAMQETGGKRLYIEAANIYKEYQDEMKKNNAMDFDDLIFNMVKIMERYKEVKDAINSRYRFVVAETSAGIAVTQC